MTRAASETPMPHPKLSYRDLAIEDRSRIPASLLDEFSQEEIETCLRMLQAVADQPSLASGNERLKGLVTKIYKKANRDKQNEARRQDQTLDRQLTLQTLLVSTANGAAANDSTRPVDWQADNLLHRSRKCYVCKEAFSKLHGFYHQLCPACGDSNYRKRIQSADLSGCNAIVTGARIKIGFQTALKLLRDGANTLVTTRFPVDALLRYQAESDFENWQHRLQIHGLDLRNLVDVESFADRCLHELESIEILIHNAAQTVRRPKAFYQHLLEKETLASQHPMIRAACNVRLLQSSTTEPTQDLIEWTRYFPVGQFDRDGQQVDSRPQNSWRLRLGEVDTVEMVECYLVNAAAPFVLSNRLRPLMTQTDLRRRFIVNVSAMEGQFDRESKTCFHPHTNMAKAALNMLTRTAAQELAEHRIYMTSVDTGWITDENPMPIAEHLQRDRGFYPPLDVIDGAARVYDPIASGLTSDKTPYFGCFLKDYQPYPW